MTIETTFVEKSCLILFVNGKRHTISQPDPSEPLIVFLRRMGLTGTKLGCAEGYDIVKSNGLVDVDLVLCLYPLSTKQLVRSFTAQ